MRLSDCHNIGDFRRLAKQRLPWPVFDYIDGAADDELTKARNTAAFNDVDLVPDVLAGVETIDTSITVMGRKSALPLILSPTALQRVFHWQGERAVARAAQKFGLWFGISSLATVSIEEIGALGDNPKMFQLYVHKDKGLNRSMIERCQAAKFDAIALTVDTIVGGKRERCLRSGFSSPPRFTPSSLLSYALKPRWALDYVFREKFALPNLDTHVSAGTGEAMSIQRYFSEMLDQSMDWKMAASIREQWGGTFCLKGVMSVADARRAVEIGADAIMISNHGGRQLDGSRAPFDQVREIVDAVGGEIEVICDGGVRRGTHVLKALAAGATCASGGRLYLYALAAAGQPGVERAITILKEEIERDMKLMGVTRVDQLNRESLRWR
ncbi:alpha-hydroxy acid oxidase [Novosphingobium mangrovi (ex Huang et al. 2023)]|uniref:Alpha-hydroxy-acid oxidizing protein n=1 Tax=Novosphingobium mangrovi (ex Huang et al. 2023) TaxID=2976432 RepID=A0ABT2I7B0_9SPHN|nr:alpha-hydroxy acid oxidase [Novosphingobium mangrovi (ex Huang et al. 2023)]MCT2400691.1 alpha-hydroxy-acid oxidizing protein [Novosphingobium mangrovi (ex Huang et al. 2023)]